VRTEVKKQKKRAKANLAKKKSSGMLAVKFLIGHKKMFEACWLAFLALPLTTPIYKVFLPRRSKSFWTKSESRWYPSAHVSGRLAPYGYPHSAPHDAAHSLDRFPEGLVRSGWCGFTPFASGPIRPGH